MTDRNIYCKRFSIDRRIVANLCALQSDFVLFPHCRGGRHE